MYPWSDWDYDSLWEELRWIQQAVDHVLGSDVVDLVPVFTGGQYVVSVWVEEDAKEVLVEPGSDCDLVKAWLLERFPDAVWELEGWR